MENLIYRSIEKYPKYAEKLLSNVKNNSDWTMLYGWLTERLKELGKGTLPQVFAVFDGEDNMVGYYALTEKEVVKNCADIAPWLGIILVFDRYRGKGYSPFIIEHACKTAKQSGYPVLYLVTEHNNYYERFGFQFLREAEYLSGAKTKLYRKIL